MFVWLPSSTAAQDAIAEIHLFTSRSYEWIVDADIEACFDNIDYPALMGRVGRRVGDKRVLALIKAFLKAGVLTEDAVKRDTNTGAPQGGILSRCCRTSPCRCWMTISCSPGRRWATVLDGPVGVATGWLPTEWSATRTLGC